MPTADELLDVHAIQQLKARYVRSVDTKDWVGFRTVFTDDFHWESEGFGLDGGDTFVAWVARSLPDGSSTVHHVFPAETTITGPDTAAAVWPMEDYVRRTARRGPVAFHGFGHYHETYRRTPDGWRIASSNLTRLRTGPLDDTAPAER
jgi:hypothetical protein